MDGFMIAAPETDNEEERLAKLLSYHILDTIPEQQFDDIAELAAHICGSKISLISLVDKHRQWFKAKVGLDAEQTPRDVAFCAHAIHEPELFYIPDATKDQRFFDNPLVTGQPNVLFYAGAPLCTPDGYRVGTLCVIDDHPRELSSEQKESLMRLSRQVSNNLELRLHIREIEESGLLLEAKNEELQQFAYRTSHDLRSPITSSKRLADYLIEDLEASNYGEALRGAQKVKGLMANLEELVGDIVSLVQADVSMNDVEPIDLTELLNDARQRLEFLAVESECEIRVENACLSNVPIERGRISQIVDNLISNGIKYRDVNKADSYVDVKVSNSASTLKIAVEDNGIGIRSEFLEDMFKMFKRDNSEVSGSGLGLAIVKKHVEHMQGSIEYSSSKQGTRFNISLPTDRMGDPV